MQHKVEIREIKTKKSLAMWQTGWHRRKKRKKTKAPGFNYCTYPHEFHGHQFETLVFETLNDLSNEISMDAIGLDHDEGAFLVSSHCS